MEPHSLQGKVVAVTGGASGIGLAIVRKLIALKAKVAVADVQDCPQELTDTTDVMFTKVDVSSRTAVHKWVQAIIGSFGRLDGMCANAGISPPEGEVASDDLFQKIFDVCCVGVWNCATEAYFQFKKQGGGGAIVTTASIGAFRYGKGLTAYGGAKSAVIGFTKGWAVEWAPHNIRVNCVAPGATKTALQEAVFQESPNVEKSFAGRLPMGRLAESRELANAFIFLLSDSAGYVSGHVLTVDGAHSISV